MKDSDWFRASYRSSLDLICQLGPEDGFTDSMCRGSIHTTAYRPLWRCTSSQHHPNHQGRNKGHWGLCVWGSWYTRRLAKVKLYIDISVHLVCLYLLRMPLYEPWSNQARSSYSQVHFADEGQGTALPVALVNLDTYNGIEPTSLGPRKNSRAEKKLFKLWANICKTELFEGTFRIIGVCHSQFPHWSGPSMFPLKQICSRFQAEELT